MDPQRHLDFLTGQFRLSHGDISPAVLHQALTRFLRGNSDAISQLKQPIPTGARLGELPTLMQHANGTSRNPSSQGSVGTVHFEGGLRPTTTALALVEFTSSGSQPWNLMLTTSGQLIRWIRTGAPGRSDTEHDFQVLNDKAIIRLFYDRPETFRDILAKIQNALRDDERTRETLRRQRQVAIDAITQMLDRTSLRPPVSGD